MIVTEAGLQFRREATGRQDNRLSGTPTLILTVIFVAAAQYFVRVRVSLMVA